MKIFCDYCGCNFDTNENDFCPSCGAPYSNDKEITLAKEQQSKLAQLIIKEKELELNKSERTRSGSRITALIITMLVVFTMVVVAVAAVSATGKPPGIDTEKVKEAASTVKSKIPVITQKEETDVPVTVGFNETAQTVKYSVICDSFEIIDRYPFTPNEGYMYVSFHFIIKNTSIGKLNPPSGFYCSVNENKCSKIWDNERKEPPMGTLPAGVSTTGNICFEVPVDAEYFDISYGDYVTIHIENTLS